MRMQMKMTALLLSLSLLTIAGFSVPAAHAAKWQTVASQDGKRVDIDQARIARLAPDQSIAWTRLMLDRPMHIDELAYNRVEVLNRYDCSRQRFTTVKRVYLQDSQPVKEEVIRRGAQRQIQAQSGSVDARLLAVACKLRTLDAMQALAERAGQAASLAQPSEAAATNPQAAATEAKVMHADVLQLAETVEEARAKTAHTQTVAEQRIGINLPGKAALAAQAAAEQASLDEASALSPAVSAVVQPAPRPVSRTRQVLQKKPATTATTPTAAVTTTAAAATATAQAAIPWSYEGAGAPVNWGKLRSDYATCDDGKRQSPIDIRDSINVDLEQIKFDYKPSLFRIIDSGHTVEVHVGEGSTLTVMGRQYELEQLHFHRPSEERINGKIYDMSVHLLHRTLDGQQAVLAILLEKGSEHPLIQTLWNNLPLEIGQELVPEDAIDLNELLPENRTYWTYMGSLTTPPCTENVLWLVMKQPAQISPEQVSIFSRLYRYNVRPVQPANNRLIKGSR